MCLTRPNTRRALRNSTLVGRRHAMRWDWWVRCAGGTPSTPTEVLQNEHVPSMHRGTGRAAILRIRLAGFSGPLLPRKIKGIRHLQRRILPRRIKHHLADMMLEALMQRALVKRRILANLGHRHAPLPILADDLELQHHAPVDV